MCTVWKMAMVDSANSYSGFGSFKTLGKTEARQSFLRILDEIKDEASTVVVTDRSEPVAVIMGLKHYELLIAAIKQSQHAKENPLEGLIVRVGDLAADNQRIRKLFHKSIDNTKKSLH